MPPSVSAAVAGGTAVSPWCTLLIATAGRMRARLRLVLLPLLLGPHQDGMVEGKLVFESVSHLGTKPDVRADPGFLLSYFAVGPKTKPFKSSGDLFTATKAPNGSALASTDGGSTWRLQQPDVYIGMDSYAAYPASYDATGRPTSYAAYVGPVVYASPAPAGHTYTGHPSLLQRA